MSPDAEEAALVRHRALGDGGRVRPVAIDREGVGGVDEPVVGGYYWVSFVKIKKGHLPYARGWIPVLGPLHEDREVIGFPNYHWHVDWRFARLPKSRRSVQAKVVVLANCAEEGRVFRRRVKCQRLMPEFPSPLGTPWQGRLEAEFEGHRMRCLTCPHRRMPLDPRLSENGVVTCTGHGLRWNVETGELVKMAKNQPGGSN